MESAGVTLLRVQGCQGWLCCTKSSAWPSTTGPPLSWYVHTLTSPDVSVPVEVAFQMRISSTSESVVQAPVPVRTRSTAATMFGSTTAALGDCPLAQPSVPPPLTNAPPIRAPSRLAADIVIESLSRLAN